MKKKTYSTTACSDYINMHIKNGGEMLQIDEGVLGHGILFLYGIKGFKNVLIKEVPLSEWSSTHVVRRYSKIPKKYLKLI